jgi:transposase
VHTSLICTWVKNYIKDGEAGLENKRKGNPYLAIQTSKSLDETARLKLIIAKQQVQFDH